MIPAAFAKIATGFAAKFGAPFAAGEAVWPGSAIKDAGGSIITPAVNISEPCRVQIDRATDAMRAAADYLATDVRLLVLSFGTDLDSRARIEIDGVRYALLSCERDPAGIGWECRGRVV